VKDGATKFGPACLYFFFDAGTDINSLDRSGRTPLHLAIGHLRLLHQDHEYSSEQLKTAVAEVNQVMLMIISECY